LLSTISLPFVGVNNLLVFLWKREVVRTPLAKVAKRAIDRLGDFFGTICLRHRSLDEQPELILMSPDLFVDSEVGHEAGSPISEKLATISED